MEPNEEQSGYQEVGEWNQDISLGALDLTPGGTSELEMGGYGDVPSGNDKWNGGSVEHEGTEDVVVEQGANDRSGLGGLLATVEQYPGEVSDGCTVEGYNLDGILVKNSGIQEGVVEQFDFGNVRFDSDDIAEHVTLEEVEQFLGYGGGYESGSSQEW